MPMWRCPHCGVPQPEVARCWVCRRSSTSCATCRSFRTSVAAKLGYCALDRRRTPLDGDEIRPCWEAAKPTVAAVEPAVVGTGGPTAGVLALRQAWEAAVSGVALDEYARTHAELRKQVEKFGTKK